MNNYHLEVTQEVKKGYGQVVVCLSQVVVIQGADSQNFH